MKLKFVYKGGPGSGHHGHVGRPGLVGGGLPEGNVSQGGLYEGGRIRWASNLTSEARFEPNKDILLGPKFFRWERNEQAEVLAHEIGHGILEITRATAGEEFWKTGEILKVPGKDYWYGGRGEIEEAATDAMMMRAMRPKEQLADNPQIYAWASLQYTKAGIDPIKLRTQVFDIVNRLDGPGPEGALMTLEEL